MANLLLFIFDFIITLPITLIRLILIYLYSSKYNIESLGFLDIMMHADKRFFNQEDPYPTLDTLKDDIRVKVNYDSRLNKDILVVSKYNDCSKCTELLSIFNKQIESNNSKLQNNNIHELKNHEYKSESDINDNNDIFIKKDEKNNENNKYSTQEDLFEYNTAN